MKRELINTGYFGLSLQIKPAIELKSKNDTLVWSKENNRLEGVKLSNLFHKLNHISN